MKSSILLILFIGIVGCDDRPLVNSEEYRRLHGRVNGEENNIQVGDFRLSIPKEYRVEVQTYGEIKYGKADVLYFWLDFSDLLNEWVGPASKVRVKVTTFKESDESNSSASTDINLEELIRNSPKEYTGLIEVYRGDGGWSYRKYIAPFEKSELEFGKVKLNCSGTQRTGLDTCWGVFDKGGLSVLFFVNASLLPKWKIVIPEINDQINCMIGDR